MSNAIYVKPFTQIVEDAMLEMREASFTDATVRAKYKRRVNDVYSRVIPARHEYDWMRKSSTLTMTAEYDTGTVAITSGGTSITGTDTVWTSAMTGRKMWIGSNDDIYTFTYVSGTTGTISPAYTGSTDETAATYSIFEMDFALAADYDEMTSEPGMYYDSGRGRVSLKWYPEDLHMRRETTNSSSDPEHFVILPQVNSSGYYQVRISPPVTSSKIIRYDYYRTFPEMVEFTTGTATSTAGSTTITLSADYSAYVSAGQYIRINPSEQGGYAQWVKITTVTGATLTVSPAYNTTSANAAYTICDAPEYPIRMHSAIFMGTCWLTAMEQNDQLAAQGFAQAFIQAMDLGIRREARRRYGKQVMRLDGPQGGDVSYVR